jgi:hypothetical protein
MGVASSSARTAETNLNTVLMPADRLAKVKASLPLLLDPKLSLVLQSPQTLWYDETVMKPSYQDSVGASSNDKWPNLVAASESIIGGLHDRKRGRWQFPFATTAGTDESTNLQVENFAYFPQVNGQVPTMAITKVHLNDNRPEWRWTYPVGTVFGEVLFLTDGPNLLPVEIRTRTRYPAGWGMNAFRPFPRATDLAEAIRLLRPNWNQQPNLRDMVEFLEDDTTLRPARLVAQAALAPAFQQEGYLDELPDFGDDTLVRELLKTTIFRSSYGAAWKQNGSQKTFAASTKSRLSIVPNHYTAGLIEVTDESCLRCHKETNRLVSEFYPALYLYGELWGMDGIFSFHPYDESRYPELRLNMVDNRYVNPKLAAARVFRKAFRD